MEREKFYEIVGALWNNIEFQIISNRIDYYVLNNDKWNGEYYSNCWKVKDRNGFEIIENVEEKNFIPIYKNEEIIGYEKF